MLPAAAHDVAAAPPMGGAQAACAAPDLDAAKLSAIDELLNKGLSPEEVCDQYFEACEANEPERWLACLHIERREKATSQRPGPFAVCKWELGRTRVAKFMAKYNLVGRVGKPSFRDFEPEVVVQYQPAYGPVPGYKVGAALGDPIDITLRQQGGSRGEWRVTQGTF